MVFKFNVQGKNFEYRSSRFTDLSISLQFNDQQPNPFGVERAVSQPYKNDDIVGDTRLGGSCNFEVIKMIPHCNGTHTECLGHLSDQRINVNEQLKDVLLPATLISINAQDEKGQSNLMISRFHLEEALSNSIPGFNKAILIRTLPNKAIKKKNYDKNSPVPFMAKEAITFLNEFEVDHLLVDFPSIDPMHDGGKLEAHREFWNIEAGSHKLNHNSNLNKTITEMIYVPNELEDGPFLLNLQIAPFASDASPSRPIVFPLDRR